MLQHQVFNPFSLFSPTDGPFNNCGSPISARSMITTVLASSPFHPRSSTTQIQHKSHPQTLILHTQLPPTTHPSTRTMNQLTPTSPCPVSMTLLSIPSSTSPILLPLPRPCTPSPLGLLQRALQKPSPLVPLLRPTHHVYALISTHVPLPWMADQHPLPHVNPQNLPVLDPCLAEVLA